MAVDLYTLHRHKSCLSVWKYGNPILYAGDKLLIYKREFPLLSKNDRIQMTSNLYIQDPDKEIEAIT